MADGAVTAGLREFDAATRALPAVLSDELRACAESAANRLHAEMQQTMRSRGWALAEDVVTEHRPSEQRYVVEIRPHPRPANLPLWLEFGTRYMAAQPFHGPAVARLRATYPQSVDAAVQRAVDRTVNR